MTMPMPLRTVPYLGLAEFKAMPTWVDLDDLIPGGSASQNDAELNNVLIRASAWADNYCKQPIKASYQVENTTARVDKWGRIFIHPKFNPVRSIAAVSYGVSLGSMTQVPAAGLDGDQAWVEDEKGVIIVLSGINGAWAGRLQFGPAPAYSTEVYVQFEYVAGYGNGVLVADTASGATTLQLDDVTGFQAASTTLAGTAYNASVARIWEPGEEEAVTVQSVNASASTLTLTSSTLNSHTAGVQVSEIPPEVRNAVGQYALGLLLRDEAEDDMPFPGSIGPAVRRSTKRGYAGGLINEAECALAPYRRVR